MPQTNFQSVFADIEYLCAMRLNEAAGLQEEQASEVRGEKMVGDWCDEHLNCQKEILDGIISNRADAVPSLKKQVETVDPNSCFSFLLKELRFNFAINRCYDHEKQRCELAALRVVKTKHLALSTSLN